MKTVQTIKTVLSKSIFICFMAITAMSCSKDEEEIPAVEADISFRVQLVKMRGTEAGESNGAMEVFGDISTSLVIGTTNDTRSLWSRTISTYISVDANDKQLEGESTFNISPADLAESNIVVEGVLTDWEGNSNTESLGEASSTLSLGSITGTQEYQLTFSDAPEQEIALTYSITRL